MTEDAGAGPGGRLILHVGTHKTGTTSFQASLKANAAVLAARGVGAVGTPKVGRDGKTRLRYNLADFAHLFLRDTIVSGHRLRYGAGRNAPGIRGSRSRLQWALDLARRPERDLILSAEAFCFLRTAEEARNMRRFIALTRRTPLILLVRRNEADWRASWTAQLSKNPRVRDGLAASDPTTRIDGEWYFDLDAIRAFWAALGDLREIDFDAAIAAEGNIVPQLYRAAGIDPAGLDVEARLNTRAGKS